MKGHDVVVTGCVYNAPEYRIHIFPAIGNVLQVLLKNDDEFAEFLSMIQILDKQNNMLQYFMLRDQGKTHEEAYEAVHGTI